MDDTTLAAMNTNGPACNAMMVRRITLAGFVANIILAIAKIGAGVAGNSHAVIADGIHTLSDTVTDIAVIAGSFFWSRPADTDHPHGHGRVETLVSVCIGVILLATGICICLDAVAGIRQGHLRHPGMIAFAAAIVSIVVKEWLYRYTAREGEKLKSPALVSNAWHHRLDAFSSIPVAIAVATAMVRPDLRFMDDAASLLVAVLIIIAALKILADGILEFIDTGADVTVCEQIKEIAMMDPAVLDIHAVRTRYAGKKLHVDLHAVVDGQMTVSEGHLVAEGIQKRIMAMGQDVMDVVVHIEPGESGRGKQETVVT